jgi:hypothetical protein
VGPCWAQPPAAAIDAQGSIALISVLGAHLGEEVLVHASLGFLDALGPVTRNRLGLLRALVIQPAPRLPEPPPPASAGRDLGR